MSLSHPPARAPSERALVLLIAAVQFVNILDFMMVMPMGPDFARVLHIPASHLGFISGSYTASAAVSGVLCSLFLDRFDRRAALATTMLGLVFGTVAGGFAHDLPTLMAARVLAGAFGGPATSLSFSIVADVVPPERRGKAMGVVMGSFSVASILGVPAGLELARVGSWRLPFFAVAALGLVVAAGARALLPPLRAHLMAAPPPTAEGAAVAASPRHTTMLLSYAMTAVGTLGNFVLIPNISAYVQFNLRYPRQYLGLLYLAGGGVSLVAMYVAGRIVDRYGAFAGGAFGTVVLSAAVYAGFVMFPSPIPVITVFMVFMFAMAFRNVSYAALTSRVPAPHERARFMSIQSAVQHSASAGAAFLSSAMLRELADGRLDGMHRVAMLSILVGAWMPLMLWLVQSRVQRTERAAPPTGAVRPAQ